MAAIAVTTANKLDLVRHIKGNQETLPAGVALSALDVVMIHPTTGRWAKAIAGTIGLTRPLYIVLKTVIAGIGVTAIRKGVIAGIDLSGLDYGDKLYLSNTSAKISDTDEGVNQQSTATMDGGTDGTFTLTALGVTTGAIVHDASAAVIQAALELVLGSGNVLCTGGVMDTNPVVVEFVGNLAHRSVVLTGDDAEITGSGDELTIANDTQAGIRSTVLGFVIPSFAVALGTSPDKNLFVDIQDADDESWKP